MTGNQNRTEEVEAGGKGEHSYYKRKDSVLCRAEKSIARWRNNKGTGRLQRSFYRGTGFCGITGS